MTTDTESKQQRARDLFWRLQDQISGALETADGEGRFHEDAWEHVHGGGGRSRVLSEGALIEKGGVNVSAVHGPKLPASIAASVPAGAEQPFFATGVSLVVHPLTPHVPTVHMNCRFFTAGDNVWWFGGGADLTPYYPHHEDAVHFHRTLRSACERFDSTWYPRFKAWCDDYFYIKHRKEHRGIGGIFFDYLGQTGNDNDEDNQDFEQALAFVDAVGSAFLDAYMPIVERRRNEPVSEAQRWFQLYRRGRYVEFNLVYDRGTVFGLQTAGRIESILMSLPPLVRWAYDWQPQPGTPEAELYEHYLKPQPWADSE